MQPPLSFVLSKYSRNMVSEAFFRVENFPAPNTKIDVAHCASHDIGPSTSRFGILLPPFHICSRIELLVCPSVQLANITMRFSSWNHRHVVPAGVETHLHPTPCRRESPIIYLWSSLFGVRGVVFFGVLGGHFFLGQSLFGSRWAYPIALSEGKFHGME